MRLLDPATAEYDSVLNYVDATGWKAFVEETGCGGNETEREQRMCGWNDGWMDGWCGNCENEDVVAVAAVKDFLV